MDSQHNFPRIGLFWEFNHSFVLEKANCLHIQVTMDTLGLESDSANGSSLCGIKFPFRSLPLHIAGKQHGYDREHREGF
jgi:hypothetical protein